MGEVKGIFYARFMDDWIVLTRSKSALRKIIKITHEVVNALKLHLHPAKTYIDKISHGFNFLAYYMDDKKILPSQETIRRFHERAVAKLYEQPRAKNMSLCYRHISRDISFLAIRRMKRLQQMTGFKIPCLCCPWLLKTQMSLRMCGGISDSGLAG